MLNLSCAANFSAATTNRATSSAESFSVSIFVARQIYAPNHVLGFVEISKAVNNWKRAPPICLARFDPRQIGPRLLRQPNVPSGTFGFLTPAGAFPRPPVRRAPIFCPRLCCISPLGLRLAPPAKGAGCPFTGRPPDRPPVCTSAVVWGGMGKRGAFLAWLGRILPDSPGAVRRAGPMVVAAWKMYAISGG